ncbi:MAG: FAD-binding protein [Alphaproteobacteria bacterium]|nr:FAD-binding protein [Alphaproteobacteria bacterium]
MQMSSLSPETCEIVIVGAGLAGYAAALALSGTGADIIMLDRGTDNAGNASHSDPRTTALSPSSFKMLSCLDVLSACRETPTPISAMKITEAVSVPKWPGGLLNFEGTDDGALAYMVRNHDLHAAFAKVSRNISNISIRQGQTVTDMEQTPNGMQLTVNNHQMICDLVVACDGRQSLVRDLLGTRVIQRDYHRAALVADFSHSLPHENIARQIVKTDGPLACLPLGRNPNGDHVSSLVWVEKTKRAQNLSALSSERFSYALSERLDGALGDIEISDTPHCFPLALMLAENYAAPHAVLLGDAAHVIHPLAGQGFNLTLRDAATLADNVFEAKMVGLKACDMSVTDGYQLSRRADAFAMAGLTDSLNTMFGTSFLPLSWLRHAGLALVNNALPSQAKLAGQKYADRGTTAPPRLLRGHKFNG